MLTGGTVYSGFRNTSSSQMRTLQVGMDVTRKKIPFRKHKANYCPIEKAHISHITVQGKTATSGAAGDLSGSHFCLLQGKKEKEAENPTALPLATHPQSPLKSLVSVLTALFQNQLQTKLPKSSLNYAL